MRASATSEKLNPNARLSMPEISIVIPAFNRAHCLPRALESIRQQKMDGLEIVLGDDASTDDTVAVALREWPGLKVARLERNSGAAAARNAALELTTGEWIAFLDSDDEWLPGKLSRQVAVLKAEPSIAYCATSHVYMRRDGCRREVRIVESQPSERHLQGALPFHGASTPVVRRSLWQSLGGQDERLRVLEDWDWALRASSSHRIRVLPDPLAVIHENSPSNPDATVASTRFFLEKHGAAIRAFGARHEREIVSRHWENAGRCLLRHNRPGEGCWLLWKSLLADPLRNPWLAAAFPIALADQVCGSRMLRRIMAARGGYSIV